MGDVTTLTSPSPSESRDVRHQKTTQIDRPQKPRKRKKKRPKRERRVDEKESTKSDSFGASLGRAMIGTLAFVFKRPVRLFRPVKLSSWTLLEAMAKRENRTLGIRYLRTLLRREKSSFLPHLLLPPLIMNATIGFVLFEGYSQTEAFLLRKYYSSVPVPPGPFNSAQPQQKHNSSNEMGRVKPNFSPLWIVSAAGFVAGAAQCIISAPLDNVRIVLQSSSPKPKPRHHHPAASTPSPSLNFSWRAIARAAILPFAPSVSRDRLVSKIKDSQQSAPARWSIIKSLFRQTAPETEETQRQPRDKLTNQERRMLWEKKLKRWRGGIHGAGLVFSLMRDSFGFARRAAYHASLAVDQVQAFASARAALPSSISSNSRATSVRSRSSSDEFHTESSSDLEVSDVSFSTSRTISGRVVAALCLIVGGAVGAAAYELFGRPFELAREVVWQGRKDWEEGKRKSKEYDPFAWTGGHGRIGRPSRCKRHGNGFVGARVKYRRVFGDRQYRNGLIDLRSGNTLGDRNSRVESGFKFGSDRPPHPLRVGKLRNKLSERELLERSTSSKACGPRLGPARKRQKALSSLSSASTSTSTSSSSLSQRSTNHKSQAELNQQRLQPSLSTRPSALTLLIEHARESMSQHHQDCLPTSH